MGGKACPRAPPAQSLMGDAASYAKISAERSAERYADTPDGKEAARAMEAGLTYRSEWRSSSSCSKEGRGGERPST